MALELQICLRRVPTGTHPAPSGGNEHGAIQLQRSNRHPPNGCVPFDQGAIATPAKMIAPGLRTRIVEWYKLTSLRISRSDPPALLLVAGSARAPQILTHRRAIRDSWNDMLDTQGNTAQPLVGVAVAAEMTSIGEELLLKLNWNVRTAHDVGIGNSASVGNRYPRLLSSA